MVGFFEGTVGSDEETVSFNLAVRHIKERRRMYYKDVSARIGLTKEQGEQIRAGRRKASNDDIQKLIFEFPEAATFFDKLKSSKEADTQTLNEPMGTHFYGKQPDPWQQLADERKRLLDKQDDEIRALKEQVKQLQIEKQVLSDTLEHVLKK